MSSRSPNLACIHTRHGVFTHLTNNGVTRLAGIHTMPRVSSIVAQLSPSVARRSSALSPLDARRSRPLVPPRLTSSTSASPASCAPADILPLGSQGCQLSVDFDVEAAQAAWVQSLHARAYDNPNPNPNPNPLGLTRARTTTTRMRRIRSSRVVHTIQDELIASDAAKLVDACKDPACVDNPRPSPPTSSAVAACCYEANTYGLPHIAALSITNCS